jgi:RNA polymerase sigma factor (sigma-70 family)
VSEKEKTRSVADIFKTYRERLLKFIRSRVRAIEDAEDIMQDVFYQFARVNELARPVEQTAAWLYRAAGNRIIDTYKKKKAIPFSVFAHDAGEGDDVSDLIALLCANETTPETETLRSFVWETIEAALNELPEAQREVFIQTEFAGLAVKEIAQKSGVPVNTLLSRKQYAVKALRKKLKALYADMAGGS